MALLDLCASDGLIAPVETQSLSKWYHVSAGENGLNEAIWLGMANLRPVLNVYYAERSSLKEISHVRYIPRDQSR